MLDVSDGRRYYEASGEGPPVLFIHGNFVVAKGIHLIDQMPKGEIQKGNETKQVAFCSNLPEHEIAYPLLDGKEDRFWRGRIAHDRK
jgi:hypothetical protein